MKQRLAFALTLAALSGGLLAAQQQPAQQPPAQPQQLQQPAPQTPIEQPPLTFRVEVNYVEVDALVTDAEGRPITNLTKDDFELFEDGKRQDVATFALVNIPIERAERPLFANAPVEADVQSNDHSEGRIYLLVLDDLHTDVTRSPRVKAAATRFIENNFGTNDLAAVVFTGRSGDGQDFTNNPRLLVNAINKFNGRKLRSATLTRIEGARVNPATEQLEPGDDIDQMDRAFRARQMANNVRKLAEFMAGVRGRRKSMLLIGEGVDYDIYEAVGQLGSTASSVLLDTHDAIAAATRGNVTIYALDPRGLMNAESDLIEVAGTVGDAGSRSIANEMRLSQDSLRVLADSTGGFAAVNRNDLNGAFDRIVTENSSYYMLGFYSTNDRRNGRYRKLEVRTKRPGLRVRNRSGYYEARGRAPSQPAASASPTALAPAVSEALGSPLAMAGVPMKVFAAAYKGQAPNAAVALVFEIDIRNFDFVQNGGTFNEQVEVAFTSVSVQGKVFPGERQTATLTLKPDTYERAKTRGLRVLSQTNLPPGRYQMRVAAGNRSGKAGSVVYDLEVPDFSKESFTMSGVSLTAASAGQAPTIKPKDPLGDFLPGPPTAAREFEKGDLVVLFAEFYENARGAAAHMLDFKAELRAEGGRVVQQVTDERSSTELQGSSGGYGFQARLPLDSVEPGLYVIHVEGRSRANQDTVASKDIQIRVR
ncbi:MAG TPA: VWA domain-containing protein [Vicinamibacterales bacterium]|nr:VWA domain-containing protein [Vicinamibacterales bacterium]